MLTTTQVHVTVMHPSPVMMAGLQATFAGEPGCLVRQGPPPEREPRSPMSPGSSSRADCVVVTDYQTALDLAVRNDAAGVPAEAGPRLLIVSSASRGWQVRQALQSGVHGYVSSQCPVDELVEAVRRIHGGERYLCAIASRCVAESFSQQHLTARELDVLRLVEEGLNNKTISRRLGIALGTVKAHVRTLLDKLDATSRTEAVAAGTRRGFIGEEVGAN
jgi:DNA-binding NarL/FixJ family response regulator